MAVLDLGKAVISVVQKMGCGLTGKIAGSCGLGHEVVVGIEGGAVKACWTFL